MAVKSLESILADHPFFKDMNPEYLKLITGCARNERFEPGQFIFRQGEKADKFYILRHGAVALEISGAERGAITVDTLGAGDILGWSWLVPPYLYHNDAHVISMTRAISLDAKCLRKKCEADHGLGYELMKRFLPVFADRLKHTELQLLDIYGRKH